jgi:hydrogenase nickel incorporation protein HypA/HybF
MHELSIAMSIIELAEEESQRRGGLDVKTVHIRLGALAGVVKDALLFSYEVAREQSALAHSELVIQEIPAVVYCSLCDARRPLRSPNWFYCPVCGSLATEVVQGKELELVALEIKE